MHAIKNGLVLLRQTDGDCSAGTVRRVCLVQQARYVEVWWARTLNVTSSTIYLVHRAPETDFPSYNACLAPKAYEMPIISV